MEPIGPKEDCNPKWQTLNPEVLSIVPGGDCVEM